MNDRNYFLGFSVFPGIGPSKFTQLLNYFGSAKKAWNASKKDLLVSGIGDAITEKFDKFRNTFSPVAYEKILKQKNVDFITINEKDYSSLLQKIKNPPFVLYIKGNREILNQNKIIAVVGSRKITNYGREVTESLTAELVNFGFTIVSGLATGVDAVCHNTAINNNGLTIAVLGCGVDCCTPPSNQALYNSIIAKNGVIISELPLSHPPTMGSFPARNRIVAGLSLGVLVTEGAEDSGALITADYAFKNNRKVFAVPGPITSSLSKGPYKLIQKGAKLVTSGEDILSELGIKNYELGIIGDKRDKRVRGSTKEENIILELLENEPLHFDEIVRKTKIPTKKLGGILSILEVKGLIKTTNGSFFSITS